MGPLAEVIEQQVALDVLQETFDELTGRSTKKWAIILVAAVAGAAIAFFVVRRRGGEVSEELPGQIRV
jgi:hypothetical protein